MTTLKPEARKLADRGRRRLFEDVGVWMEAFLKQCSAAHQPDDTISWTPDDGNLCPRNQPICVRDPTHMWNNDRKSGSFGEVVTHYLQMICSFVNAAYNCNKAKSIPRLSYMAFGWFEANVEKKGHTYAAEYLQNKHARVNSKDPSGRMNPNLPASRLSRVKYLFIPIQPLQTWHVALIVISPKNQTVDLLDSKPIPDAKRLQYFKLTFKMLIDIYGNDFMPRDWRIRYTRASRQELRESGSTRYQDCTVFAMTHALQLGFGYPLTDFSQQEIANRRKRVAMDLINGKFYDEACALDPNFGTTPLDTLRKQISAYPITDFDEGNLRADGFNALDFSLIKELETYKVDRSQNAPSSSQTLGASPGTALGSSETIVIDDD